MLAGQVSSLWIALICSIIGLIFVWFTARDVTNKNPGTQEMRTISRLIQKGAMAFLKKSSALV